jgi:Transcription factor WhiB
MVTVNDLAIAARPQWWDSHEVKCHGLPPKWFYPNRSSSLVIRAKAICSGVDGRKPCLYRDRCLEWAVDHKEDFGVWGGTSERDRRKIQRARNRRIKTGECYEHIYTLEEVRFPGVFMAEWRRVLFVVPRPTEVLEQAA